MWGIAAQAGAGAAIAGLTAAYYAMASRGIQGEKERMSHEVDPDATPETPESRKLEGGGDGHSPPLSSGNMLLKKELYELSVLNGSVSGLNVFYQQSPIDKFPPGSFELTPEDSSESIDSASEDKTANIFEDVEEEIIQSSDNHIMDKDKEEGPSGNETSKMSPPPELISHQKVEVAVVPLKVAKRQTVGEKWKSVQETGVINRTTSPICFFRNPGFGHRYVFKTEEEPISPLVARASQIQVEAPSASPLVARVSQIQIVLPPSVNFKNEEKEIEATETATQEELKLPPSSKEDCQDSTQFLLPPVPSDSTISVFEKDINNTLLQRGKRKNDESPENKVSSTGHSKSSKKRRMITKLRKRSSADRSLARIILRADPNVFSLRSALRRRHKSIFTKRRAPPPKKEEMPLKSETKVEKSCGEFFSQAFTSEEIVGGTEAKLYFRRQLQDNDSFSSGGVIEEPLLVPSEMKLICGRSNEKIKPKASPSLGSLPVQVFRTTMRTMPWRVVTMCAFIVIVFGILGMYLIHLNNRRSSSR